MIIKQIAKKSANSGSFKGLANYILDRKNKDIEIHSGVDSLLTWIKEVLKDPKSSLDDLHQVLADYNLELKPKGNGIVIADKTRKLFVKASDVHRDLSKGKLEKRFGEFKTSNITITPRKKYHTPSLKASYPRLPNRVTQSMKLVKTQP